MYRKVLMALTTIAVLGQVGCIVYPDQRDSGTAPVGNVSYPDQRDPGTAPIGNVSYPERNTPSNNNVQGQPGKI